MGFLLYIISMILGMILIPIGFLYGLFKQIYKNQFFKSFKVLNAKFRSMAVVIDIYGNVVCAELFNATLLKKESTNLFGNNSETISICIGKNLKANTLSKTGMLVNNILNKIDPGHTTNLIL